MKKISRFATLLVLATSFTVPLSALAACPIGYTVDLSNSAYCVSSSNLLDRVANTPSSSGSSGGVNPSYLQGYASSIIDVINRLLVPVLIAIAFIVFLWGVFNYFILGAADEKKRIDGRQFVLWGIIGFVVIFSVWSLVNIVSGTLGFPTGGGRAPRPPTL